MSDPLKTREKVTSIFSGASVFGGTSEFCGVVPWAAAKVPNASAMKTTERNGILVMALDLKMLN
jgi:hypothetical protein